MVEVFNSIVNIAVHIEKDVFKKCSDFLDTKQSDEQMHRKVFSHCKMIMEREFDRTQSVKSMVMQETKETREINAGGKYIITCNAIDNMELLDVDFSLGSIFGIYENALEIQSLKAAIYVTYGPTFQMVYASKDESGAKFFAYEHGAFRQQESFTLKDKGKINSTGGDVRTWPLEHKALVEGLFNEGYRLRFSDSLSLDTHQILFKKGGLYSNPATKADPTGRLELYFDAYPIAFIVEYAGGEATDGKVRILDKPAQSLEEKTPLYFGSAYEMQKVKEQLA